MTNVYKQILYLISDCPSAVCSSSGVSKFRCVQVQVCPSSGTCNTESDGTSTSQLYPTLKCTRSVTYTPSKVFDKFRLDPITKVKPQCPVECQLIPPTYVQVSVRRVLFSSVSKFLLCHYIQQHYLLKTKSRRVVP